MANGVDSAKTGEQAPHTLAVIARFNEALSAAERCGSL